MEMGAHMLLGLGDSSLEVQQMVNRYRSRRYRDILPERAEYWSMGDLEANMEGLQHRWYHLSPQSPLLGLSLAEANIRRLTGTTVMAIERKKRLYRYPTGEILLEPGDRLLVVGNPEEHMAFLNLLKQPQAS
jgi:CPA2 family monovalent cation:H+ antiporter-2